MRVPHEHVERNATLMFHVILLIGMLLAEYQSMVLQQERMQSEEGIEYIPTMDYIISVVVNKGSLRGNHVNAMEVDEQHAMAVMKGVKCHNCNKFGHYARDCKEPKKVFTGNQGSGGGGGGGPRGQGGAGGPRAGGGGSGPNRGPRPGPWNDKPTGRGFQGY